MNDSDEHSAQDELAECCRRGLDVLMSWTCRTQTAYQAPPAITVMTVSASISGRAVPSATATATLSAS
ncbi:MAG: hypothetical protein ACXWEI_09025 [Mycobacterium sp.]